MTLYRLYTDLAPWWTLLSPPEDYAEEAFYWRQLLRAKLGPGRHRLLELGVGGGHNLSHLTAGFDAEAVDLSPDMARVCRALNPEVPVHVGDMRAVRLDRAFDAVLVHDAVMYMVSADDVRALLATARAHLRPGGVFVTSPDFVRETFADSGLETATRRLGNTELTYAIYTCDPHPADTWFEEHFTVWIREGGGAPRVFTEVQRFGLFSLAQWRGFFEDSGFTFETRDYPVHGDGRPGYLLAGVLVTG